MRRRPSEDQGCLLVRHLFYSMSQIPFMVEDGGQRFIRIPGEEGTYMRDYVIDPEGRIESLVFTDVNHNRQAEITP